MHNEFSYYSQASSGNAYLKPATAQPISQREIDATTCKICSKTMSEAVLILCGDSFCEICIRGIKEKNVKYLSCPSCNESWDGNFFPNRAIRQIISLRTSPLTSKPDSVSAPIAEQVITQPQTNRKPSEEDIKNKGRINDPVKQILIRYINKDKGFSGTDEEPRLNNLGGALNDKFDQRQVYYLFQQLGYPEPSKPIRTTIDLIRFMQEKNRISDDDITRLVTIIDNLYC